MLSDKIVGVVAEFNPFHNGHKYQVDEILKYKPKLLIAIISGDYVQRGEISFLTKEEKTKIALENGYDLVVELPFYYSIQNADIFCEYATKILSELGVQYQVFGVESTLYKFEDILSIQKEEKYIENLKKYQKEGNSYITSHSKCLEDYGIKEFYKSNNILALSYVKSIIENKLDMNYFTIKRKDSNYNDKNTYRGNISSATYLRNNIENSNICNLVPKNSFDIIKNKKFDFEKLNNKIFSLFKYILNVKSKFEIMKVYDFDDNIYNRMIKTINKCNKYDEFINEIYSRNISINRIKRFMLNVILEVKSEYIKLGQNIKYIRVLGINFKGASYIKSLGNKKIFVNWKDLDKLNFDEIKLEKNSFVLTDILINKKEKLNTLFI